MLTVTRNIGSVEVEHRARCDSDSGYSLRKIYLAIAKEVATSFSIVPLRLASLAGWLFARLGFLFAPLFIIQKFTLFEMPDGRVSLMVTLLTLAGVQLVAQGVLGEYLGQVLLRIDAKPQYVIGSTVGLDEGSTV